VWGHLRDHHADPVNTIALASFGSEALTSTTEPMTERVLDSWVAKMASELDELPRRSFGMFFAYLAERLMPLYFAFQKKHLWGDATELRRHLDSVWLAFDQKAVSVPQSVLRRLEALTPSGERFDSPDSTYAQDVVVCVDAAVRSLISQEVLDGNWVEYAVEPVKTRASIESTGFSSIEGAAAASWESHLMGNPRVAEFLADCEGLLAHLKNLSAESTPSELRAQAHRNQIPAEDYIGA
jgi:uncharacterized protein YjaG (DUF416 family)